MGRVPEQGEGVRKAATLAQLGFFGGGGHWRGSWARIPFGGGFWARFHSPHEEGLGACWGLSALGACLGPFKKAFGKSTLKYSEKKLLNSSSKVQKSQFSAAASNSKEVQERIAGTCLHFFLGRNFVLNSRFVLCILGGFGLRNWQVAVLPEGSGQKTISLNLGGFVH